MGTIVSQAALLHATIFANVDLDSSDTTIIAAAKTVFSVEVDNSDNIVPVFLNLWDLGVATAGAEDYIVRIAAGTKEMFILNGGEGVAFGTEVHATCTTTSGGSTSPTNNVTAKFWTS